jgi:elongation factor Ts
MSKLDKDLILKLRSMTSAGMLDCKKALENNNNDLDLAAAWLINKGIIDSASKANRETNAGVIAVFLDNAKSSAIAIEVNTETDFVARNDKFQHFVSKLGPIALQQNDIESLLNAPFEQELKVKDALSNSIAQVGENIVINKMEKVTIENKPAEKGILGFYVHNAVGTNMGSIVSITSLYYSGQPNDFAKLDAVAKFVSIHIATCKPKFVSLEKASTDNNSASRDDCLITQGYVLNEKYTVEQFLKNEADKLGLQNLYVENFIRLQVGK